MENPNTQSAKTQLAIILGELEEKRANPFKGTPLGALSDEIRALRKTYRLSYREIAEKLKAVKVETSEEEIGRFCRYLFKSSMRKNRRAKRPGVEG